MIKRSVNISSSLFVVALMGCSSPVSKNSVTIGINFANDEPVMTDSARALLERLIRECYQSIKNGTSEDDTVLRCYSRKLNAMVNFVLIRDR